MDWLKRQSKSETIAFYHRISIVFLYFFPIIQFFPVFDPRNLRDSLNNWSLKPLDHNLNSLVFTSFGHQIIRDFPLNCPIFLVFTIKSRWLPYKRSNFSHHHCIIRFSGFYMFWPSNHPRFPIFSHLFYRSFTIRSRTHPRSRRSSWDPNGWRVPRSCRTRCWWSPRAPPAGPKGKKMAVAEVIGDKSLICLYLKGV